MFQFCVNGVNMAFDLRKMKLYDRGQVYKLNSSPAQVNGRVYFKLTDSCNLSCIYCFQNNDSKSGINPINIADFKAAVCELLCRKNTDFYMFGGEPFLDSQYENVLYLLNNSDVTFHVFTNGCFSQSYCVLDLIVVGSGEVHLNRR